MLSLSLCLVVASFLLNTSFVNAGRFSDLQFQHRTRKPAPTVQYQDVLPEANYRYLNKRTSKYRVKSLPNVPYDIGEMYSGNIPIDYAEPSRTLFFVWQPKLGKPVDEIVVWLNGGPGCSSLIGFFQENGRFTWQPGTYKPVQNDYSWVNLTNVLFVEQPVGTGFATGEVRATTQEETAQDFVKFFKHFQKIFGIKNYKVYVAGESYAGRYVPYISAAMLDEKDKEYYDMSGAMVYDPCIGDFTYTQEEVPVVPFVQKNANLFNFSPNLMDRLENLHQSCGYANLLDKYLSFPPPGHQPPKFFNFTREAHCDLFDLVYGSSLKVNPCFNIYEVNSQCPILDDVLSFPTTLFQTTYPTYFNRRDVKEALHAPLDVDWAVCASKQVFKGGPKVGGRFSGGPQGEGDLSADPIQKVLPQVIEATNRVIVANGDFDMIIISDGTLLAIQNMTWNGMIGFQDKPYKPYHVPLPDLQYAELFEENGYGYFNNLSQGIMGIQHYERGLLWVETYQAGHEGPQYQPRAAYRHLQWLLRRIEHL